MEKVLVGVEGDFSEFFAEFFAVGLIYDQKAIVFDSPNLTEELSEYSYIIAGGGAWNEYLFTAFKNKLKMLVKFGVGVDNMDIDAALKHGIYISNAPGSNSLAVAEHTIMLMLALVKKVACLDRMVKNGIFDAVRTDSVVGKKVGIIGFGNIGRKLAELLKSFPVEIGAYDDYFDEEAAKKLNVRRETLSELVETSDIISLHIPSTTRTHNIVNKDFFEKMKKGSYLINTSRASIVNENDLISALKSGILAGAALDTFNMTTEGHLKDYINMENVLLTPHNASITEEAFRSMMKICVYNIIEFHTTGKCKNIIKRS